MFSKLQVGIRIVAPSREGNKRGREYNMLDPMLLALLNNFSLHIHIFASFAVEFKPKAAK